MSILREKSPQPSSSRLSDLIIDAQVGFASGLRDPKGVIHLRMNNVTIRGTFDWSTMIRVPAPSVPGLRLLPGDVVFNNTNSADLVGKSALFSGFDETVYFSNHFTRLRTSPELLLPAYLAFWLQAKWQSGFFSDICNRWVGQAAVQREKLLALPIEVPPIPEQLRIVELLTDHLGAVERARAAAEARLEAAKALEATYLREVFQSVQSRGWKMRRLEEFAETCSGSTPDRGRADYYGGGIPWVKTGELKDAVVDGSEEQVTEKALAECSLRLLAPGTVLVAMYGQGQTRGRTGLLSVEATTNQACFAVLPNPEKFDSQYLQLWFRNMYSKLRKQSEGRGGNQPNLNGVLLRRQEIPLPPLPDQMKVVSEVSESLKSFSKLVSRLESEALAVRALPTALLRRAFRGEL